MKKLIKLSALLVINIAHTRHSDGRNKDKKVEKPKTGLGAAAVAAIVLGSSCLCCTVCCGGTAAVANNNFKKTFNTLIEKQLDKAKHKIPEDLRSKIRDMQSKITLFNQATEAPKIDKFLFENGYFSFTTGLENGVIYNIKEVQKELTMAIKAAEGLDKEACYSLQKHVDNLSAIGSVDGLNGWIAQLKSLNKQYNTFFFFI